MSLAREHTACSMVPRVSGSHVATPEMQLLLDCARVPLNYASLPEANNLLTRIAAIRDWGAFLLLTRDQHLVPAVYKALSRSQPPGVPRTVIAELRTLYLRIAALNMRLTHRLHTIQQTMMREGITCIPIKGPALALQAFGSTSSRQFGDLDLVIPAADMQRAGLLLADMGFRHDEVPADVNLKAYARLLQEWKYVRTDNATVLDIHPVVVSHTLSTAAMGCELVREAIEVPFDENRTIHAPDPATMLMVVCMNGAHEMWKKLSDVVDARGLIDRNAEADWQGMLRRAERWGQKRSVLVGVCLAKSLLGGELPGVFAEALRTDAAATGLAEEAAQRIASGRSIKPDTVRERVFEVRTRDSWRGKWRSLWREVFIPSAVEINMLRLPRPLWFIYSLIRPVRLLWDAAGFGPRKRRVGR